MDAIGGRSRPEALIAVDDILQTLIDQPMRRRQWKPILAPAASETTRGKEMNGADCLAKTLLAGGVNVCFTNPGTSEMHFVAALDSNPEMRCVLGLFEGVVTGAADGYYRMADRPASTLLHLGPGLANGLANLHNAKKANSSVVNIVGEHASYHLKYNAPLTSDIEGFAAPVSHWIRTSKSSQDIGRDGAAAIDAARKAPGEIATLILPADTAWSEATTIGSVQEPKPRAKVDAVAVKEAAAMLTNGKRSTLLLGGASLRGNALTLAGKISAHTGCGLLTEGSNARLERGAGRVAVDRVPYVVDKALKVLEEAGQLVLVGATVPVAFFAYPDKPSELTPEGTPVTTLAPVAADLEGALQALADEVGANDVSPASVPEPHRPQVIPGANTPASIASVLGAYLPENAIVVDESVTTGRDFFPVTEGAPPHDWLNNRGGSIGYGLPVALGASIACPDRKVIALASDGSTMYTVQALWTMAREKCDVTVLVFANSSYNILRGELTNVGVRNPGQSALNMLSLDKPELNWVDMAHSMGVAAVSVSDSESLAQAFQAGLAGGVPNLIEIKM